MVLPVYPTVTVIGSWICGRDAVAAELRIGKQALEMVHFPRGKWGRNQEAQKKLLVYNP